MGLKVPGDPCGQTQLMNPEITIHMIDLPYKVLIIVPVLAPVHLEQA